MKPPSVTAAVPASSSTSGRPSTRPSPTMATRSLSFDKASGEIDHSTAAYWREHYDLDAILQRNWPTLRPKLRGKIHLYVGSDDTYMLNDAVYLMEDFLKTTGTTP